MIRASVLKVSRRGLEMRRRENAQPIENRTMQATMFCIALIRAQISPSAGILSTDWMIPPVTMSAVPMVSSTNPQKIPACMTPRPDP